MYVALVVIAIGGEPWYTLIAALGVSLIPGYFTANNVTIYLQIIFGVLAAMVAVFARRTPTVPLQVRQILDRLGGRQPEHAVTEEQVRRAVVQAAASEQDAARQDKRRHGTDRTGAWNQGARREWAVGPFRRRHGGAEREPHRADGVHHRVGGTQRGGEDDDVQRVLRPGEANRRPGHAAWA